MNNKNQQPPSAEHASLLGRLTREDVVSLIARAPTRQRAEQMVDQTAYMRDPNLFQHEQQPAVAEPTVSEAATPAYIATSTDTVAQVGQTAADERLATVTDLVTYRTQRETALQAATTAAIGDSQPHDPELLNGARRAVEEAFFKENYSDAQKAA